MCGVEFTVEPILEIVHRKIDSKKI
jgi:hypothetical protein